MYEQHFGLKDKPFAMQPDPSFIYWGKGHSMAYTMLEYGVLNNIGFTVITGEIGCGKSTLVRLLLKQLDDQITVGLLSNTRIAEGELLRWVMLSLGQPFEQASTVALFRDFQNFLIEEYANYRRTVLIVDEAQNLSANTLEELRMLSNINAEKDQLLQIVLVGQPQLLETLRSPALVQLVQRISADFHIQPLSPTEVYEYMEHRIAIAGATRHIFTPPAGNLIARASKGVPRVINMLCETALVYGFAAGATEISANIVQSVIDDKRRYGLFFGDDNRLAAPATLTPSHE
jgi:type II secretory pathway predicted ATPase ExeA